MKRSLVLLTAALCFLGMATPAAAQLSPSTSGSSTAPTEASQKDYWWMLRQMGDCLADTKTEKSQAFLAAKIDSADETREFKQLFGRSRNICMRNFVRASIVRSQIRGVVAEGMYRRNLVQVGADFVPAPNAPAEIASLHDFARCYVNSNYAEARALLRETRLATEDEAELVKRMAPGFALCLPEGRDIVLKPINVRMSLAEALYHATIIGQQGTR